VSQFSFDSLDEAKAKKFFDELEAKIGQKISPCYNKTYLQSFTVEGEDLILWYNTPDKSTHLHFVE